MTVFEVASFLIPLTLAGCCSFKECSKREKILLYCLLSFGIVSVVAAFILFTAV